jgi:predicted enzyme related to lactoylglutathione lyase
MDATLAPVRDANVTAALHFRGRRNFAARPSSTPGEKQYPSLPAALRPSGAPRNRSRRARMANPFVHVELNTQDLPKAKKFYSQLFGWQLQDMPMGGGKTYTMIGVGEGTGGGMMTAPDSGIPPHWLAYVGVDDIDASTKKAKELGATLVMGVTPVANYGKFSIFKDPTGALFAMWQSSPQK